MSAARRAVRKTDVPAKSGGPAWPSLAGDGGNSLLDVVDNLLNKGVVVSGDVTLALADVDLVYLRLTVLLCAADRVMPAESPRHEKARRRRR